MKKPHRFLLLGIASVFAAQIAFSQAQQAPAAAAPGVPNNWEKEYNDGKAAYAAGNYREAEKQLKAALKSTRDFASNDPKLLNTLHDLAQVYRAESKYQDAEPLMERYLTLHERFLGKYHPDLAKDLDE